MVLSILVFSAFPVIAQDNDAALCEKGTNLNKERKSAEAIECYQKSIELKPDHFKWLNKGAVYDAQNMFKEALACYDKAIELCRDYPNAWYNKGLALYALGRYEEAAETFKKCRSLLKLDNHEFRSVLDKTIAKAANVIKTKKSTKK